MFRLFDNPLHLIVLLVVVLIIFGAGKLPSVGNALGTSIKEFKRATNDADATTGANGAAHACPQCQTTIPAGAQFCSNCGSAVPQLAASSRDEVFCSNCGEKNTVAARFCAKCGTGINVRAG